MMKGEIDGSIAFLVRALPLVPTSGPARLRNRRPRTDRQQSGRSGEQRRDGEYRDRRQFLQPEDCHRECRRYVVWTNKGRVAHDVTAGNGAFSSPRNLAPGASFSYTATTAGTFAYQCTIHVNHDGVLTVQAAAAPWPRQPLRPPGRAGRRTPHRRRRRRQRHPALAATPGAGPPDRRGHGPPHRASPAPRRLTSPANNRRPGAMHIRCMAPGHFQQSSSIALLSSAVRCGHFRCTTNVPGPGWMEIT